MFDYDIIIAGAGMSGLSLALELLRHPDFQQKKILLLDRDRKERNDRTWCFWAKAEEPLPPILYQSWKTGSFFSSMLEKQLQFEPYRYHMVRGIDFYRWAKAELAKWPNVVMEQAELVKLGRNAVTVRTETGERLYTASWIFNSAFLPAALLPEREGPAFSVLPGAEKNTELSIRLLQHFKGWLVETREPVFDPACMTFMDFRVEQQGQTRFVYVLPFSETRALVEFTVFSPALLAQEEYDRALKDYLDRFLKIKAFTIEEQEFGVIPMTDHAFQPQGADGIISIGTAGGFVKASSGYAFLRTQRKVRVFVEDWVRKGRPDPQVFQSSRQFRVLDAIFLRVLAEDGGLGQVVFSRLFDKLPAALVLAFLDEDTTFWENLRLVGAPPPGPFLRAAFCWRSVVF